MIVSNAIVQITRNNTVEYFKSIVNSWKVDSTSDKVMLGFRFSVYILPEMVPFIAKTVDTEMQVGFRLQWKPKTQNKKKGKNP